MMQSVNHVAEFATTLLLEIELNKNQISIDFFSGECGNVWISKTQKSSTFFSKYFNPVFDRPLKSQSIVSQPLFSIDARKKKKKLFKHKIRINIDDCARNKK